MVETKKKLYEKATVYIRNEMIGNYIRIEVKEVYVWAQPSAQYSDAVGYSFRGKKHRRFRGSVEGYKPSLMVLDGWGHIEPDWPLGEEKEQDGMMVRTSRHTMFSDSWDKEFGAKIDRYLSQNPGVKVLEDFRDFDTGEGLRDYRN